MTSGEGFYEMNLAKDNLKLHPYKDPVECRRGNYWEKGMHINDVEPAWLFLATIEVSHYPV